MRILICTDNFYPGIGGTEAAVLGYAETLTKEGHEVLLACPEYGAESESEYPFEIVRFPSLRVIKNNPIVLTRLSQKKFRRLLDFHPDIVHLETLSGMAKIGLRAGKNCRVPVVMTMHTKILDAYRQYLPDFLARLFLRIEIAKVKRCDALITVANCMLDEIRSYGCAHADEVHVIRNGAVFDKHPATREERKAARFELGIGVEENVLLFVGRLVRYKQVEFVLRALKIAKERGFSFKYIVVGDGEDAPCMQNAAKSLGIGGMVSFVGAVSDRELVKKYYTAADLFVTASIFDTDPIVVLEAASMGVASLVTENSGCSERIVDGKNGYTAAFTEEAFAARILEIFSDKDALFETGACATDSVLSTWEDTVRAHLPLYGKLRLKKHSLHTGGGYYRRNVNIRRHAACVAIGGVSANKITENINGIMSA